MLNTTFITAGLEALSASIFKNHVLTSMDYKFMEYVVEHGKSYATSEEYKFRADLFKLRDSAVEAFNLDDVNTHVVGHNLFSDRTIGEMR